MIDAIDDTWWIPFAVIGAPAGAIVCFTMWMSNARFHAMDAATVCTVTGVLQLVGFAFWALRRIM